MPVAARKQRMNPRCIATPTYSSARLPRPSIQRGDASTEIVAPQVHDLIVPATNLETSSLWETDQST